MKTRQNFHTLLASVMLAATAGLMTACTSNDYNPTPSGPSESVIKEKIVGKWKGVTQDGVERVTNRRTVMTFFDDGSMTYSRAFPSSYMEQYNWENRVPFTYTVSGNIITREGLEPDGQMRNTFYEVSAISNSEVEMNLTGYVLGGQNFDRNMMNNYNRIITDYSEDIIGLWEATEMTGEQTYNDDNARLAFLTDGTYKYYRKSEAGEWQLVSTRDIEEYFVDGDFVATRWQEKGGEMNYEWWDIDEIKDGQMKWSALREREDGTRFTTTFTWRRIGVPAGVEAVDLGLPSGTKWANMNIGAEKPEDDGLYFAWGETMGYGSDTSDSRSFDWASYKWCNGLESSMTKYCNDSSYGTVDNKTVLDLDDDAAYVNWGSSWRMPTFTETKELLENTTNEWTTINGVNGRKFTSKTNGNSIFLPAAGLRIDSYLGNQDTDGIFWSSSLNETGPYLARTLSFDSEYVSSTTSSNRYFGFHVRPVQ